MKDFNKEDLEFFMPPSFKGLSKQYMIDKIFDKDIQKDWKPKTGDIIVGETGNVFVISSTHVLVDELGGNLYFFGGGLCNRTGGNLLNETYSFTMNKDGLWYQHGREPKEDSYHSSFYDFRYVPYPHELIKK